MLLLAAVGIWALLAPGPARAAETDQIQTTITIVEPSLSIDITSSELSFGNGVVSDSTYFGSGLSMVVTDSATPTQVTTGWNVTAHASDLVSSNGQIPASGLTFHRGQTGFAATPVANNGTSNPPLENLGLGSSTPLSTTTKILTSAAANDSKGAWAVTWPAPTFRLTVPGTTNAGTYTGTLTMTIQRGL